MMNKEEQRGSVGTEGTATYSSADVVEWNVEDNAFWEAKGKGIGKHEAINWHRHASHAFKKCCPKPDKSGFVYCEAWV